MENENKERSSVAFLEDPQFVDHFADIHSELIRGYHFLQDDYPLFDIISSNYKPLDNYYRTFYKIRLRRAKYDSQEYYYLDSIGDNKGEMANPSRHKELSEELTIMAIILINMYYYMFLEKEKVITWAKLKSEIEESENKESYKKLFFSEPRETQTDREWDEVHTRFKRAIQVFTRLGWVKNLAGRGENVHFELRATINRIANLYEKELENFDEFANKIYNR